MTQLLLYQSVQSCAPDTRLNAVMGDRKPAWLRACVCPGGMKRQADMMESLDFVKGLTVLKPFASGRGAHTYTSTKQKHQTKKKKNELNSLCK